MMFSIQPLYERFAQHYPVGERWWPGNSLWEIWIGAILVQNTRWYNVELSLTQLRQAALLTPQALHNLTIDELIPYIRSSGFYQAKARALIAGSHWFASYDYDLTKIRTKATATLRQELLALPGIGNETADVLLVYLFDKVVFIADTYARRLFQRLDVPSKNYRDLQRQLLLPADFTNQQAQELHGWIVDFGKEHPTDTDWQHSFLADLHLPKKHPPK